jgi:hypothetical protein
MRRREARAGVALPPWPALAVAAVLATAIFAAGALVAWLAGSGVALAFGMGVVGGVTAATSAAPALVRVSTGALLVAATLGGAAAFSSPWATAAVVALVALCQAPLTARACGVAAFAPVVAAVFASVEVVEPPVLLAAGVALGYVFVQLLSLAMRLPRTSATVDPVAALVHAVAFASLAGPAMLVTQTFGVDHGYWLLLTLAVVLQPSPTAGRVLARARLTGTLTGVVVAVVMVLALPPDLLMVAAGGSVLLSLAWGVAQDVGRTAHYGVLAILFLGSGGNLEDGVGLGLERLVLTACAVVLAVLAYDAVGSTQRRR